MLFYSVPEIAQLGTCTCIYYKDTKENGNRPSPPKHIDVAPNKE